MLRVVGRVAPDVAGLGFVVDRAVDRRVTGGGDHQPHAVEIGRFESTVMANGHRQRVHRRRMLGRNHGDHRSLVDVDRSLAGRDGARADDEHGPTVDPKADGDRGQRLGHRCKPHSVLPWPAQRPARASAPSSTGEVQGRHPMEG